MFDFAFKSIEEAIYMNGHGIYVWFVVTIVIVCLISALSHYKIKLRELKKKFNESEKKKKTLQYFIGFFIFCFWNFTNTIFVKF